MKHATIITAALLSGCAIFSPPPGTQLGDTWIKRHEALPYVWEVVPASEVAARCSFKYEHPKNACAIRLRDGPGFPYGHHCITGPAHPAQQAPCNVPPKGPYCLILASMDEAEARNVYLYTVTGAVRSLDRKPETLWAHEVKHCNGYDHLEAK